MAKGFNSRGMGGFGGGDNLVVCSIQASIADIIPDGAVIEPGILEHHAEQPAQVIAAEIADVIAINQNSAFIHVVKPHQ